MRKIITCVLICLLVFGFSGCNSKNIAEYDCDLIVVKRLYETTLVESVGFIENAELNVTEYICISSSKDVAPSEEIIVKPDHPYFVVRLLSLGTKKEGWCCYITVIAKSNDKIVGYAVMECELVEGYIEPYVPTITCVAGFKKTIIKSVRFSNEDIENGVSERYVKRAVRKCIRDAR